MRTIFHHLDGRYPLTPPGPLAGERAGMKLADEDTLVARHCGFRLAPLPVLGLSLPSQANALGDALDAAVPLGRLGRGGQPGIALVRSGMAT